MLMLTKLDKPPTNRPLKDYYYHYYSIYLRANDTNKDTFSAETYHNNNGYTRFNIFRLLSKVLYIKFSYKVNFKIHTVTPWAH